MPHMSGDDEAWDSEPPPAAARNWMHPSEVGQMQAALVQPEPRRLSISTVLIAGSFGAVAMFVLLAGVGVLQSPEGTVTASTPARSSVTTVALGVSRAVDVLTVERRTAIGTVTSAGIVLDEEGHVLTMSTERPDVASLTVHRGPDSYSGISVVGYDPSTDVTLLSVHGLDGIEPTLIDGPNTHDKTSLLTSGDPSGTHGVTVTDATAAVHGADESHLGLVALESMVAPSTSAVLVTGTPARIVGVVSPVDDVHGDNRYYATSARVMQRVGSQLLDHGRAVSAALSDSTITEHDRILQVDQTPTGDPGDLANCLMAYSPGDRVTVMVEREGERHSIETTLSTVKPAG